MSERYLRERYGNWTLPEPPPDPELERIADAFKSDAQRRKDVLTRWGAQRDPLVLAPTFQQAKYWLVSTGDDYLGDHGSYSRMTVSMANWQALRGWRGLLVIVIPVRSAMPREWDDVLDFLGQQPGITTWTERLP